MNWALQIVHSAFGIFTSYYKFYSFTQANYQNDVSPETNVVKTSEEPLKKSKGTTRMMVSSSLKVAPMTPQHITGSGEQARDGTPADPVPLRKPAEKDRPVRRGSGGRRSGAGAQAS